MSKVQLQGNVSGTGVFTIASPNSNTDRTLTLPDSSGTLLNNSSNSNFPTGSILQVVFAQKKDTQSIAFNAGTTALSGLSASITPKSSSSKILVQLFLMMATSNGASAATGILLYRNGSNITDSIADAAGSRQRLWLRNDSYNGQSSAGVFNSDHGPNTFSGFYLDSPASTSAQTYAIYFIPQDNTGGSFVVNRCGNDSNTSGLWGSRSTSGILLMEVAG